MPFTTYHLASSLLVGVLLRGRVNWLSFLIVSTFLVDVEPLAKMVLDLPGPLHGLAHTFAAAAVLGPATGLALYAARGFLRPLSNAFLLEGAESLGAYALGGAAGWALHVFMDMPLYPEMKPFYPLEGNPLLLASVDPLDSWLGVAWVYDLVLASGFFAYAAYLYFSYGGGGSGRAAAGLALMASFFASVFATAVGQSVLLLGALVGVFLFYSALWGAAGRGVFLAAAATLLSASLLLLVRRLVFGDFEVFITSFVSDEFYVASWYVPLVAGFALTWPALRRVGAPRLWLYATAAGVATLWILVGGALLAVGLLGLLSSLPRRLAAGGQA
ncbi:hypothetical protein [Pyrobaculum ferrireducens]|nr:hypothetical protein [Pyrobaculum ferrireducens]